MLTTGLAGWYLTTLLAVPPDPARLGLTAAVLLLPATVMWVLRT